jgi:DNA polymerase I-like protein with 3'-5' exonuclease and polymerase domains
MSNLPFALLTPGDHPARQAATDRLVLNMAEVCKTDLLAEFCKPEGGILVIDLETQGVDSWDHTRKVVGMALSDASGTCYLDIGIGEAGQAAWRRFLVMLWEAETPLLAHNLQFDAAWMSRDLMQELGYTDYEGGLAWHTWHGCTLAMYKHLASEGWMGQRHGLKQAMVDLLGWPESNEAELDAWLCDNGYGKWVNKKDGTKEAHPNKAEMWRAPAEILGAYAALDAEATFLLWDQVLKPVWQQFLAYQEYHQSWLCGAQGLQYHLVWQKLRGVNIDKAKLQTLRTGLEARLVELEQEFRTHEDTGAYIDAFELEKIDEVRAEEPARWKKLPVLGAEPDKYTKTGAVSKSWVSWETKAITLDALRQEIGNVEMGLVAGPLAEAQQSFHWKLWKERLDIAYNTKHFNMRSAEHLRTLFYDKLQYPVQVWTDNELDPKPGTDEDARKGWGPAGKLLITYGTLEKLRSSVVSLLEKLDSTGRYHPELRAPGTHTGRLSGGGGYNWQNAPKCKEILECMQADPGHTLLACDVASLEQVVLANLSGDEAMMKIYGPGAKPNDIYLFNGSQMGGFVGAAIRGAGYDPDNPTPEGIAAAKKLAKKERSISKVYSLAAAYGAGPGKIRSTLAMDGVEIALSEAKRMHGAYWGIYKGVKQYARWLEAQWERNGGWVLNGIGRPVCVAEDFKRDLVNRVCQSTGHDVFMTFAELLAKALDNADIPYKPFNWDLHDACYFLVPDEYVSVARNIVDVVVVQQAARMLGGNVGLKWDANVCKTVADDKTESMSVKDLGVKL